MTLQAKLEEGYVIYPSAVSTYFPCNSFRDLNVNSFKCGNGLYASLDSADGLSGIYLLKTGTCRYSTGTKPVFEAVRFTIATKGEFLCYTY